MKQQARGPLMAWRALAVCCPLFLTAHGQCQSFNVDFNITTGIGSGPPASSYAGAGTAGEWNTLSAGELGPKAIMTTANRASGASITRLSQTTSFASSSVTPPASDIGKLLLDFQTLAQGTSDTITISGLAAGVYTVYTFAINIGSGSARTSVHVAGSSGTNPVTVGGFLFSPTLSTPNTHSVHTVTLATHGGSIVITPTAAVGTGVVNGVQLVHSSPTRFYVNAAAPSGGDGLTWSTAFNNLQTAITSVNANPTVAEVWVAAGTYKPAAVGGARSSTFTIPGNRNFYGGFVSGNTLLSQRNPSVNVTTLSGDLAGNDASNFANRADNCYHVVTFGPASSNARLDGFRITGGHATGTGSMSDQNGGGVLITNASNPVIDRCTITDNFASDDGAAVRALPTDTSPRELTLSRCTITGNRSGDTGAAFRSTDAKPLLVNCTITGNDTGGDGTVHFRGGTGTLHGCLIASNTSFNIPGVVFRDAIQPAFIRNCTVAGNRGINFGPGLLWQCEEDLTIANTVIDANFTGAGVLESTFPSSLDTSRIRLIRSIGTGHAQSLALQSLFTDTLGPDGVPASNDESFVPLPVSGLIDAGSNTLTGTDAAAPDDRADLDADGNTTETLPFDVTGTSRRLDTGGVSNYLGQSTPIDIGCFEHASNLRTVAQAGPWSSTSTWGGSAPPFAGEYGRLPAHGPSLWNLSFTLPQTSGPFAVDGAFSLFGTSGTVRSLTISGTGQRPILISGAASAPASLTVGQGVLTTSGDIHIGNRVTQTSGTLQLSRSSAGIAVSARRIRVENGELIAAGGGAATVTDHLFVGAGGRVDAEQINGEVICQGEMLPTSIDGSLSFQRSAFEGDPAPSHFAVVDTDNPNDPDALTPITAGMTLLGSITLRAGVSGSDPLPAVGSFWTILSAAQRTGTFDTAFLPGDATKLVRLIYEDSARSSAVIAQVDSRTNVQSLNPPIGFTVPGDPAAAAVGKIRNDALEFNDLAVVVPDSADPTGANGVLKVLLNLGTTATTWNGYAAIVTNFPTQRNPSGVCVADFNADGLNDIAVSNRNGSGGATGTVSVFRNNGAGSLVTPATIISTGVGREPSGIAAGDITGDGKPDIVVTNSLDNTVSMIENNSPAAGVPSFDGVQTSALSVGINPAAVCIADFDADGDLDVGVANRGSDSVSILYNNGAAIARETGERAWNGFAPTRFHRVEAEPSSIQPGNIDNGKELEIVTTNNAAGSISVLAVGPDGDYAASSGSIGESPDSVALLDIDNDPADLLDIVAVTNTGGTSQISVLQTELGDSGEILLTGSPPITPPDPPALCLADDLNGDGTDDLIAINPDIVAFRAHSEGTDENGASRGAPSTIKTLLNFRPCPADLTLDRLVNTTDLVFFLGRFGQTPTPGSLAFRADFNGDGAVNTADLVFFLGRFGQTCP